MSVAIREAIFTAAEKVVLDEYFEVPEAERSAGDGWREHYDALGIGPEDFDFYPREAPAVAAILLRDAQAQLPNWAQVYRDGRIERGRDGLVVPPPAQGAVSLLPQFLFQINWASTGPGIDWPNDYHLVWVPGYDRYVVTSSADSPEGNHGYCDLAIGHASDTEDPVRAAARIVRNNWQAQRDRCHQECWEELLAPGMLDSVQIVAIALRVWPGAEALDQFRRWGTEQGLPRAIQPKSTGANSQP